MNESQGGFIVPPEIAEYILQHPNEVYISWSPIYRKNIACRKRWQFWKPKVKITLADIDKGIPDNGKGE